jgi:hypothetical protein
MAAASNAPAAVAAGAPPAAPQQLSTQGGARATVSSKATAVSAFNRFLSNTDKYKLPPPPKTLETLDGATLSAQEIWREFAWHLCDGEADGDKKGGTIVEYLRKVFGVARDKFSSKSEHASFYAEVALDADANDWFKGMVRQVCAALNHCSRSCSLLGCSLLRRPVDLTRALVPLLSGAARRRGGAAARRGGAARRCGTAVRRHGGTPPRRAAPPPPPRGAARRGAAGTD